MPILEWTAFAIGTLGTVLWAGGYTLRGRRIEGWLWLVSSLLWIWFAVVHTHNGLAARDLIGLSLYIAGIVKTYRSKHPSSS